MCKSLILTPPRALGANVLGLGCVLGYPSFWRKACMAGDCACVRSRLGMFVAGRLYDTAGRYMDMYPLHVSCLVRFLLLLMSDAI